jgi:hypothetical protein
MNELTKKSVDGEVLSPGDYTAEEADTRKRLLSHLTANTRNSFADMERVVKNIVPATVSVHEVGPYAYKLWISTRSKLSTADCVQLTQEVQAQRTMGVSITVIFAVAYLEATPEYG